MSEITLKQILPAAMQFSTELADNIEKLTALGVEAIAQKAVLEDVSKLITAAYNAEQKLSESQLAVKNEPDLQREADLCYSGVFAAMQELRTYCDRLETLMPKRLWPFPTYGDLLLYV